MCVLAEQDALDAGADGFVSKADEPESDGSHCVGGQEEEIAKCRDSSTDRASFRGSV